MLKKIIRIFRQFWANISISKKLYLVVGIMAILILLELFTLTFAMYTHSAVRAFVGGEGLWSKSQKIALSSLKDYALTSDPNYYAEFEKQVLIPLGDHQARIELQKDNPNIEFITKGFLQGRIAKEDIPRMVFLIRKFGRSPYIRDALRIWAEADDLIFELIDKGKLLHKELQSNDRNSDVVHSTLHELNQLDKNMTLLEDEFSYVLGVGSRWIEKLFLFTLLFAVVTVESTVLMLTVLFSRRLMRGLNELNRMALRISKGNFDEKVVIRSRDEIGQLAHSLNAMAETIRQTLGERVQAENANRIKSLFLANMSHEIRTPLGAVLGFSELLRDPHLTHEERMQYVSIIQSTGESLTKIINDILDVSKVEAGRLKVEKTLVSLSGLINEIRPVLNLKCEEKGIALKIQPGHVVSDSIYTDYVRLRQILMNIVGNAIKFTDKGEVIVSFRQEGQILKFEVLDTGIGIDTEHRDELFQVFMQADNSLTKKHSGTGLGLALSKRLAQMLGGDVRLVESEKNKGCRFEITIALPLVRAVPAPLNIIEGNTSYIEFANRSQLEGCRILLAEDSVENQILVQRLLSRFGADIEIVSNGQEAVAKAMERDFHIVLMDMQMPVLDGYSATEILRSKGFSKPIVALTAHAMKEDREHCLSVGCDEYLTKPINLSHTVTTLERIYSRQKTS